ncbi:hypothetical protein C3L57_03780 [Veillonellaceae bacterium M2-8]|nr:hypothetical protein [Veillonellaceae bacterium M2-8]
MYDHTRQYRCTIIRGKSQKEMDDLLPAYAKVIDQICPCKYEDFEREFNTAFQNYLPESERIKKTLDNHRTEISGKLFGMYYFADDGMVYQSERTQKYLEDNDQPAFFKDICFKMQFPNGMQKVSTTVLQRVNDKIRIRPNSFVLKLLQIAQTANVDITKKDLGYYVLNSLDVLQGKASPYEVLEVISQDKKNGIERDIVVPDKASSYTHQHINEQINYLEMANLIRVTDDKRVILNPNEKETIDIFANLYNEVPEFDVYSYNLEDKEEKKQFQFDWDRFYARVCAYASKFATTADSLLFEEPKEEEKEQKAETKRRNLTEFGDEGEALVYEYEKNRVSAFNVRLANKVLSLGKTKGIGYDIQSVIAEAGDEAEFVKYIEVKSTKRFTTPDVNDDLWIDTLNVTRNEWVAAHQHRGYYFIYRVYFTRKGVSVFVISDVAEKIKDGRIQAIPSTYRFDFSNSSVDGVIALKGEEDCYA